MALSAKEASSAIGPLGVVVGALNPALGLMLGAVKRFGDAIGAEAQRFKDVSPDVAMAIAQNDASREMSRLRQAETIGPTLARFERTRGRASEVLSESITDLKAALLRILEPLLPIIERGAEIAAGTTTLIAALLEELQALSALTSGQIQASMEHHAEAVKLAEKSIKTIRGLKEDDAAMVDPMLMKALGLLDQVDRNFMRGANPRVLPQFAQMNPG